MHVCVAENPVSKKDKTTRWIGHELAHYERPGLTVGNKASPGDFRHRGLRIAADVVEFPPRHTRMFLGPAIEQQPECEPDKSPGAGNQERPAPSPSNRNPGHDARSDDGAHI